ncbi:hypothetical protein K438DRAFT_1973992 [Mycena galopus ATCC 62051]|nr:hypothetical protein K438DRAFT_1973992 [Mycena galopus ATCC 62051]
MTSDRLTHIPADIHFHLLGMLADFHDLAATILTHRCFHDAYNAGRKTLLHDVARNFLGCHFHEALSLARVQAGVPLVLSTRDLSPSTVALIVNNDQRKPSQ